MTQNTTINTALLGVVTFLGGAIIPAFAMNFWYGIADIVALLAVAAFYELIP